MGKGKDKPAREKKKPKKITVNIKPKKEKTNG